MMKHFSFFIAFFLNGFHQAESKNLVAPVFPQRNIDLLNALKLESNVKEAPLPFPVCPKAACPSIKLSDEVTEKINSGINKEPSLEPKNNLPKKSLFPSLAYYGLSLAEKIIFFMKAYQWTSEVAETLYSKNFDPISSEDLAKIKARLNTANQVGEVLSCSKDLKECERILLPEDHLSKMKVIADTIEKSWYHPKSSKPSETWFQSLGNKIGSFLPSFKNEGGASKEKGLLSDILESGDREGLISQYLGDSEKLTHLNGISESSNLSDHWTQKLVLFLKGQSTQDKMGFLKKEIEKMTPENTMELASKKIKELIEAQPKHETLNVLRNPSLTEGSLWKPAMISGALFYFLCPAMFNLNASTLLLTAKMSGAFLNYLSPEVCKKIETGFLDLVGGDAAWTLNKVKNSAQWMAEKVLPNPLMTALKVGGRVGEWMGFLGEKTWGLAKHIPWPSLCFNHYTQKALNKVNEHLSLATPLVMDYLEVMNRRLPLHTPLKLVQYGKKVYSQRLSENKDGERN